MAPELIQQLGNDLFSALRERKTLVPFTNRFADITVEDAYGISLQFLNRRVAAGERVIGKKIGVTSKPVQDMLSVFQPDFGFFNRRHALRRWRYGVPQTNWLNSTKSRR